MKRLYLIALVLGLLTGGSLVFGVVRSASAGVVCDAGSVLEKTHYSDSVESNRERICYEDGELIYTLWFEGLEIEKRPANPVEVGVYTAKEFSDAADAAEFGLVGDVEPGKNAVAILRDWSVDAKQVVADWGSYSTVQILAKLKILFARLATLFAKFADLLVTLNY